MKEIELVNKKGIALVDDDDYERLSKFRWRLSTHGYAITGNKRMIQMHRLIIGAKPDEQVDHVNINKLDNRKGNNILDTQRSGVRNVHRRDIR